MIVSFIILLWIVVFFCMVSPPFLSESNGLFFQRLHANTDGLDLQAFISPNGSFFTNITAILYIISSKL